MLLQTTMFIHFKWRLNYYWIIFSVFTYLRGFEGGNDKLVCFNLYVSFKMYIELSKDLTIHWVVFMNLSCFKNQNSNLIKSRVISYLCVKKEQRHVELVPALDPGPPISEITVLGCTNKLNYKTKQLHPSHLQKHTDVCVCAFMSTVSHSHIPNTHAYSFTLHLTHPLLLGKGGQFICEYAVYVLVLCVYF